MKQALRQLLSDFLSAILFLVVYAVSGSPFAAGGIAVAAGLGQLIRLKLTHRQIEPMQWMSLGLVVVLGSATMLTAECRPREGGASPLRTLLAAFWGRVNEPQISQRTANSSCSRPRARLRPPGRGGRRLSHRRRAAFIRGVSRLAGGRIDAVVANAGGGPPETSLSLNFFGALATLEGLRPLLANSRVAGDAPAAMQHDDARIGRDISRRRSNER